MFLFETWLSGNSGFSGTLEPKISPLCKPPFWGQCREQLGGSCFSSAAAQCIPNYHNKVLMVSVLQNSWPSKPSCPLLNIHSSPLACLSTCSGLDPVTWIVFALPSLCGSQRAQQSTAENIKTCVMGVCVMCVYMHVCACACDLGLKKRSVGLIWCIQLPRWVPLWSFLTWPVLHLVHTAEGAQPMVRIMYTCTMAQKSKPYSYRAQPASLATRTPIRLSLAHGDGG